MGIAIVTGASSGIGREFARQIKKAGEADGFLLIARRRERLEALAEELGGAEILCADLCLAEGIAAVEEYLRTRRPRVKVLINAAGFGKFGDYAHISDEATAQMIDLNVRALVLLTQKTLPYMERGGYIVQMGSGSCFTPLPYLNVYAASKAFVLHYTKGLRDEIAPAGVTATCFCPGWVDTEFLAAAEAQPGAVYPKKYKPLLQADRVVAVALRRARKGKVMAVTNWYTKLQHLMFKLCPDRLLVRVWRRGVLKIK